MLSPKAQKILNEYFNLPFTGVDSVRCPYFNNARHRKRAELRALIGKGSPAEIVEEAKIISLQYHAGLFDHAGNCSANCHSDVTFTSFSVNSGGISVQQQIRKFLINNDLGVECSGFVTHILRAHFLEIARVDIAKRFYKTAPGRVWRSLIAKLRPVENISVAVWADDRNTKKITDWKSARSGDVIIILEKKLPAVRNHIILITDNNGQVIKYSHARAWSSEGKYGHGVAGGEIKIVAPAKSILEQEWTELGKTGDGNETWAEAKTAKVVEVRRVKF